MAIDKQRAIELVRERLSQTEALRFQVPNPAYSEWHRNTRVVLERIFGATSDRVTEFGAIRFFSTAIGTEADVRPHDEKAFNRGVVRVQAFLKSILAEIEQFHDESAQAPGQTPPTELVGKLCERFHAVARSLRDRHDNRETLSVQDEYDVQDLLKALLAVEFRDVRREEWTPSYAGKSARMDFLLKAEQIVVEVKKTRQGLGAKEIGDELIVDIARYANHSDCKTLICFVYDPEGLIGNPTGMEKDLSRTSEGGLVVRVYVRPTTG